MNVDLPYQRGAGEHAEDMTFEPQGVTYEEAYAVDGLGPRPRSWRPLAVKPTGSEVEYLLFCDIPTSASEAGLLVPALHLKSCLHQKPSHLPLPLDHSLKRS